MITPFSAVPSRQRPSVFASEMDQFLSELSRFVGEANTLEQSLQLTATTGTSVSTLSVVTGSVTVQTQAGKAWVDGSFVYLASAASAANFMHGQVLSYNTTSGVMVVNVLAVSGAGTYSAWVIGLAVPSGTSVVYPGSVSASSLEVDPYFRMAIESGRPVIRLGTDDYLEFNRTAGYLVCVLDGSTRFYVSAADGPSRDDNATSTNGLTRLAQVQAMLAAACPIGEIKAVATLTAPDGMLLIDGKSIGSPASGATSRANSDVQTLFYSMWALPGIPLQDSTGADVTRGASAAADWTANKRLRLFTPDGGAFLRMWAPGQTRDAGRVAGSLQLDALQGHEHGSPQSNSGGFTGTYVQGRDGGVSDGPVTTRITQKAGFSTPRVADETYPYNLAVPHYIRYRN